MIRIFKTSLFSPLDSPEVLTAESGQQTSPGRRGIGRKSPGRRSPGGGASLLSNKRLTLPFLAVVAVLAAGLLFLMPGGLLQAQENAPIMYAENGEDAVATFTATDPEGSMTIVWSLATDASIEGVGTADVVDNALFTFDEEDGMLKFRNSPDYEASTTGGGGGDADNDNTYHVVVLASDAAEGGQTGYHKVTVMVTDVAEMGEVAWTVDHNADDTADTPKLMQFQAGARLTASVDDGDIAGDNKTVESDRAEVTANPTWRWYRSPSKTAMGTMIDRATSATYDVTTADVGMYLRVVAYYLVTGNVDQETASLTSDYPVLQARAGNNALKFSPAEVSKEVSEGDKGMNVGAPVTATGNHGAVNYTLTTDDDATKFKIDQKTGQITTDMDLDYDATTGQADNCRDADGCSVTVMATDASGDSTAATGTNIHATVTIDLKNVDDKPTFPATALTAIEVPENSADGVLFGDTGYTTDAVSRVTYTATDPETRSLTYSLMGPDGAKFQLSASQVLSFRTAPDYEMPGDANRDNVYMVTVRASDGALYDDRMVRVNVIRADDAPKITEVDSPIKYAENGKDSVVTFMATDQDGDTVTWAVADGGTGILDFEIDLDDGVLEFLSSPDYEVRTGGDDNNSNTYVVTVTASSTGTSGTAQTDMFNLTVMVTKVAEKGEVTWTVDPDGTGNTLDTTVNGGNPIL